MTDNQHSPSNPVGRFMVAVGAIIENIGSGKILLLQRNDNLDWHPGEWEIPYGRLAQFEDVDSALKREVFEETGLSDIVPVKQLSIWHIFRGEEEIAENELIGITNHCQTNQTEIKLSAEHQAYQWLEPEKALELVKVEGIKEDIVDFINSKQQTKPIIIGKDVIGVGVGAVIVNDRHEILLMLRGPQAKNERNKWEIPGGSVEFGETFHQALHREIMEEIGVEIEILQQLPMLDNILPKYDQHWVSPTYLCKIISGKPHIMEPNKCADLRWFTVEETNYIPLSNITKIDMEIIKRHLLNNHSVSQ